MAGETLITVEHLAKKFCRDLGRSLFYGVWDSALDLTGQSLSKRKLRKHEFWALDHVGFELKRGECLGLIGRNGAGKTTMLKLLNGLIKPDEGRIAMTGRIGSLIALGAGFNPVLTGRENIYINGSVLGLSRKQIDGKIDEIVAFAEMDDFIDSPVMNYSSGMSVRLGFSIFTALNPDILILDEVLAVGDVAFRNKCYNRVGEIMKSAAVIFVSHDMDHIAQVSTKVMVLSKGRCAYYGDTDGGIEKYKELNQFSAGPAHDSAVTVSPQLERVEMKLDRHEVAFGESLTVSFQVEARERVPNVSFRFTLQDCYGQVIFKADGRDRGVRTDLEPGMNRFAFRLGPLHLRSGKVLFTADIADHVGASRYYISNKMHELSITGLGGTGSWYVPDMDLIEHQAPTLVTARSTASAN